MFQKFKKKLKEKSMQEGKQNINSCKANIIKRSIVIVSLAIALILILAVSITNQLHLQQKNSSQVSDVGQAKERIVRTYDANMIINELDKADNTNLAGNKIKITESTGTLDITAFDINNSSEILADDEGKLTVPNDGLKLYIQGIQELNSYDIEIENDVQAEGYASAFKKATIVIDALEENSLSAYVKDITKIVNGNEVTENGSKENTAIFLYEDNQNRIKIKGNKDLDIYYIKTDINGLTDEELAQKEWNIYDKENGIEVETNGKIYAKAKFKTDVWSEISEISITNIDKLKPTATLGDVKLNEKKDEASISFEMKDADATTDYGKSGIYGYAITKREVEPADFISCEDRENPRAEEGGITEDGKYHLWVADYAKNVYHTTFEVTGLNAEEEKVVAVILECPEGAKDLEGKEFNSLAELLEELDKRGITEKSGEVVVQIVGDISNESVTIDDKDIKLDLNGYTVQSKIQEPTITVKSGNLTVVDDKYDINDYIEDAELREKLDKYESKKNEDGSESDGKIVNNKYVGIQVNQDASLVLGEDNTTVDSIERPDTEAPIIYGGIKGVLNLGGEFDFYDGQIHGKIPVEGQVTDTPVLCDPTIGSSEKDGWYKATVQKVSGIEAVIGKTRYVKLEDAIKAARSSEEPTEIDIVVDIIKEESVLVDNTKNIILDLNGYGITNMTDDYIFINSGKMEVKDSSAKESAGTGKISSTTIGAIYNNEESAEFILTSGIISVTTRTASTMQFGINNVGKVLIKDGTIEVNMNGQSSRSFGIYNENGGYAEVTGGTINVTTSTSYINAYGIYNSNKGTAKLNGGTINVKISGSYSSGYGMYNDKNETDIIIEKGDIVSNSYGAGNNLGTLTMNGGNITSNNHGIYNIKTSTITVNDGNIKAPNAIYNENLGEVIVKGGTISGNNNGIYNFSTGTVRLEGGVLESTTGIYNYRDGKVIVTGGEIRNCSLGINNYNTNSKSPATLIIYNVDITSKANGIENRFGDLTIYNATINAKNIGIYNKENSTVIFEKGQINIESNTGTGIWNEKEAGTIIVGKKINKEENEEDTEASNTNPSISGPRYGVLNLGKFYFYDGIIKGNLNAIVGIVDEIEEAYELVVSDSEDGEEATLGFLNGVAYVGEDPSNVYDDLQAAIDACGDKEEKITLLKDITMISTEKKVIAENQNITLNLNGKEIYSYSEEDTILNNGKLVIDDTTSEGKISGYSKNIIRNKNELIINNGTFETNAIYMDANAICNEESGNVTVNGGTIHLIHINNSSLSGRKKYGIINNSTGMVTIDEGTILFDSASVSGYLYGIENNNTGKIVINNVNIEGGTVYNNANTYGILNNSTGEVLIQDASIKLTNNYSYGVQNANTGLITINKIDIDVRNTGIENQKEGTVEINNAKISNVSIALKNSNGISTLKDSEVINGNIGVRNENAGEVTITGVKFTLRARGIENYGPGNILIDDVTIETGTEAIYNVNTGTITIKDINIPRSSRGIVNTSTGTIILEKGTIESSNCGIENTNLTGTIILGIEDYEVPSITNPSIKGSSYGIRNSGIFNFYDGILEGASGNAINGVVANWAEGYNVMKYEHDESEEHPVESGRQIAILEKVKVAYVESKKQGYYSLEEALEAADEEDKIKLLLDISISVDQESEEINKDITLDIAGHTIDINKDDAFIINKSLILEDSMGTGKIQSINDNIFKNNESGTMKVKNISIDLKANDASNTEYKIIDNYGTLSIEGGEITVSSGRYSSAIYNRQNGEVTVKSGEVNGIRYGILNCDTGTVVIDDGKIYAADFTIQQNKSGTIYLNNGTVEGNGYGIRNEKDGSVIVTGGKIIANFGIYNITGTVQFTNADIEYSNKGIYNYGIGTVTTNGGTIKPKANNISSAYGIQNNGGKIEVQKTIIEAAGTNSAYGVYTNGGEVTVISGTISALLQSNYSGATISGIFTYDSNSIITLGEKGKEPGISNLTISSSKEGIHSAGKLNYYDGKILGTPNAIVGTVNDIEEGYDVVLSNVDDKEQAVLGHQTDIAYIGTDEATKFNDLQTAIEACSDREETITILKDFTISTTQEKEIAENQNITINLNGKEIRTFCDEYTITNKGSLKIKDSSEDGKIFGYSKNLIRNSKELVITNGKFLSECIGYSDPKVIYNEEIGTVTVSNGLISINKGSKTTGIYSNSTGDIIVNGGTIEVNTSSSSSNSYGIYNEGSGAIKQNGGEINVECNYSYSTSYGIYNENSGLVTVENGTIDKCKNGIYNKTNGNVTFKQGEITSLEYGIYNEGIGNILVEGGTINANNYGIYNRGGGNSPESSVTFKDGTINSMRCGIYCGNTQGELLIQGGKINVENNTNLYGVQKSNGKILMTGGTISLRTSANYQLTGIETSNATVVMEGGKIDVETDNTSSTRNIIGIYNSNTGIITVKDGIINATGPNAYGIYNGGLKGEITIGEDDKTTPSTTFPDIYGEKAAIYNNGIFNYYDGILKSNEQAINGMVSSLPEEYEVKYRDNLKTATLGLKGDFENSIYCNGKYYDSLETVVNVISYSVQKQGVVQIFGNIDNMSTPLTIPANTDITIALQGNELRWVDVPTAIINEGKLTIIDFENIADSEETIQSSMINESGTVILNNNTLVIGQEKNKNPDSPKIQGKKAVDGIEPVRYSGVLIDGEVSHEPEEKQMTENKKQTRTIENSNNKQMKNVEPKINNIQLALKPEITYSPTEWTKNNVKAEIDSEIIPILNLYSSKGTTYKVKYYYDNNMDEADTETYTAEYGEKITGFKDKPKENYSVERTENLPLEITEDKTEEEKIVKVFYKLNKLILHKVDEYDNKPLANAKFKITTADNNYAVDENGKLIENSTEITFKGTGAYPWTRREDGMYQSENSSVDNTTSVMRSKEFTVKNPVTLKFQWSASSESASRDYVYYLIKNLDEETSIGGDSSAYRLGGNNGTTEESLNFREVKVKLEPGRYQIEFTYKKDGSTSTYLDKAYVKNVTIGQDEDYYYETNADGIIEAVLPTGEYKAIEMEAPSGYLLPKTPEERETRFNLLPNEPASNGEITITNQGTENFILTKVDEETNAPLKGAKFTIKATGERTGKEYETDEKGKIRLKLEPGTYDVTETEAPTGYQLPAEPTTQVVLDIDGSIKEILLDNEKIKKKVIVHHLIDGTDQKVPAELGGDTEDDIIEGKEGESYTTHASSKIAPNYEFVRTEGETSGTMIDDVTEVKYYYKLKDPKITSKMDKTGTDKISEKNEKISYTVKYTATIEDYIGDATITIVDQLPYHIDKGASDTQEGVYDPEHKTLTWTQDIKEINSYRDEKNTINIIKNLELVFTDMDLNAETITNEATGKLHLNNPEKNDETQDDATTKTGFKIDIPVEKIWDDDSNENNIRPNEIEVVLKENGNVNKTVTLNKDNKSAKNSNKWEYTFEDLPKYDERKEKITYTVEEKAKSPDDLKYYDTEITGDDVEKGITITNTSKYGKVIVHHYIFDTKTRVPTKDGNEVPDDIYDGIVGDEYKSEKSDKIAPNYEFIVTDGKTSGKITRGTTEVIYYYRLKQPKVTQTNIIKEALDVITEAEQEMPYTMKYSAVINEYIGDATLTIEDKLPYYIDEKRSDLADGKYDSKNKTITWVDEIKDINSYENKNNVINITKKIKLVYKDIKIVDKEVVNKVKGTLHLSATDNTYENEDEARTKIDIPAELVIKYKDKETGKEIEKQVVKKGKVGEKYDISKDKKDIPEYTLVEEPKEKKGTFGPEKIEKTYYYLPTGKVSVRYVDQLTKEDIAEKVVIEGYKGKKYKTEKKKIGEYKFVESTKNTEGTMAKGEIEVIYYYARPAKVVVKYVEKATNKEIEKEEIIKGYSNDKYETTEKQLEYYKLLAKPENAKGNMAVTLDTDKDGKQVVNDTTYVTYYYEKKVFNFKLEKLIDSINRSGSIAKVNDKLGKVELYRNNVTATNVEVVYILRVINDSEITGKATIKENIPNGMIIESQRNPDWTIKKNTATLDTDNIKPGESREYKLRLTWKSDASNVGMKTNTAELVNIHNDANFEEQNLEDNIDKAEIIIAVETGKEIKVAHQMAVYTGLIAIILSSAIIIFKVRNREKK